MNSLQKKCRRFLVKLNSKGRILRRLAFVWSGLILLLPGFLRAQVPSNTEFLKELARTNWKQLEQKTAVSEAKRLIVAAGDSTDSVTKFVTALFREIAFSEQKVPVFSAVVPPVSNGVLVRIWVESFHLNFQPLRSHWFGKKKWVRKALLKNRFEVVNLKSKQLLWAGSVKNTAQDTLFAKEVVAVRGSAPGFLRGNLVGNQNHLWNAVRVALLIGISVTVVGLFYSVRTA